jgi:hypothetical protein
MATRTVDVFDEEGKWRAGHTPSLGGALDTVVDFQAAALECAAEDNPGFDVSGWTARVRDDNSSPASG